MLPIKALQSNRNKKLARLCKDEIDCELADMQKDERVANALRKMFKP